MLHVANGSNKWRLRFDYCVKYYNQEKFAFKIGEIRMDVKNPVK